MQTADQTLYFGGPILPFTDPVAPPPQALLVQNGRIAALGDRAALALQAPDAAPFDLGGAALMPAFLDAHGHFSSSASALLQVPLGNAANFADIQNALRTHLADTKPAPGRWILAAGYDHNALAEQRHPDRAVLDAAVPDNPVLLQHVSGHAGVLNSAGLAALGITPDTPVPAGGAIGAENGRLTGYLAETAFVSCLKRVPAPCMEDLLRAYAAVQEKYAACGITTLQEGAMPAEMLPLYRSLLASGLLRLDVVGYPEESCWGSYREQFPAHCGAYSGHFKLGGVKLFLDGSPQARTAWVSLPYLGRTESEQLPGPDSGWCGQSLMSEEALRAALRRVADAGLQVLAHCNGDAAADQFLSACAATAAARPNFVRSRPVMIHAQLLRPDQLPRLKKLGMIPSFFVAHVYHWGDTHIRNFGIERASRISPAASALAAGVPFTFHQDSPVLPPDMLETAWCAAVRKTKAGVHLGPQERIPVYEALRALTAGAAYQYFEENEKGTLAPGKRADLTILDKNPLAAPPEALREIKVLATIKDGAVVWRAGI